MTGLAAEPRPFDLCGPLPTGVTVLEASAGTGKTFAIAALATRYVAEGTPLERLLLVTFTRMATGELRERVRERLVGLDAEDDTAGVRLVEQPERLQHERVAELPGRRCSFGRIVDDAAVGKTETAAREQLARPPVPRK